MAIHWGSLPAVYLAAHKDYVSKIKFLILEAPIGGKKFFIHDSATLPLNPTYFSGEDIDNSERIKKVKAPLLWLHGKRDDRLRWDTHGQGVYDNHAHTKYKKIEDEGQHSNLPLVIGCDKYTAALYKLQRGQKPF